MNDNKTKPTDVNPADYLASLESDRRRADAEVLVELLSDVTGEEPVMWGPTMIGFGEHHYVHSSGREGDTFLIGFAPRKANLVLYGLNNAPGSEELLAKLGKHKTSKACLYVNKLADVDLDVLRQLTELGVEYFSQTSDSAVPR